MTNAIDKFLRGYVTAALWSSNDESRDDGGDPLDQNYDASDIAPETMAAMRKDCEAFMAANEADLIAYMERYVPKGEYTTAECAGHDFWLTRNGHGVGFWDRDLGALGDRLTEACEAFGEVNLYVGDDGQIWSM